MQDSILIEQMKLSERAQVLAFLKTAYADNPRHSDPKFWDWHFPQAPCSDAQNLPVWLAKSGDRISGQLAAIPVELNIDGKIVGAMWILDLIVDPDFRRRGIAKKLVLAAEQFCPYMLGVNTNEQHAPAMLIGLGWKIVSKIPRYHKILFPGEAIKEISRHKSLRNTANALFAPFRPKVSKNFLDEKNLRTVEKFDSSFDEFWSEASDQWTCSISRKAKMLSWQFARQPDKKFDILCYYENKKLLGYAVLFFRKPNAAGSIEKAAISDICYHPADPTNIVDALLQGALQLAIERKAGGLVTDGIDLLLEERLRLFGFYKVNSGLQLMAKASEKRNLIYDSSKWFLTRGDSDISIFEHPNLT